MSFKGVEKAKEKSLGNFGYQAKKRIAMSYKNEKLRREANLEEFKF